MPSSFLCLGNSATAASEDQSLRLELQPYEDEFTLSRTVPTLLDKEMSISRWAEFCENVDEILEKARNGRRWAWRVAAVGVLVVLGLCILGARRYNNDRGVSPALIASFPGTMLVVVSTFCFFSYRMESRMKVLCETTSTNKLLFMYKEERALSRGNADDRPDDEHVHMHYYFIVRLLPESSSTVLEEGLSRSVTTKTATASATGPVDSEVPSL